MKRFHKAYKLAKQNYHIINFKDSNIQTPDGFCWVLPFCLRTNYVPNPLQPLPIAA